MRTHDVLLILAVALTSGVRYSEQTNEVYNWQVIEYSNGTIHVVDVDETYEGSESSLAELKENVLFYLYSLNQTDGCLIGLGNESSLTACNFDGSLPTRILIHGWENSITSTICVAMREALLGVGDYNVLVIDWDTWAAENYILARMKIAAVGQFVGLFIDWMAEVGMNTKDLIIYGHSLGAHIAGVASRNATVTVPILIGMDPAGPLFYGTVMNARLRATDATCTEMIHTSAGMLGYSLDLADINYWPNGGCVQPGCGIDLFKACAHGRSHIYVTEAITTDNFTATACNSYSDYEAGNCAGNATTYMGFGCALGATYGDYYLDTNPTSPYSEG